MTKRMPRPKGKNTGQLSVNLPEEWIDELDQLAETMALPGMTITRADVFRAVIRCGLDELKARQAKPEEGTSPRHPRRKTRGG
jgi:hypothetical protein